MPEVESFAHLSPEVLTEYFKRIETRLRLVGKGEVKRGVKSSTVKTHWSKLNGYFSWLEAKHRIKVNPLKGIKPPHPIYEDPKSLQNSDIHRIYSAIVLKSQNSFLLRRDTMMVSLLVYTGIRKSEFINLRVNDFDLVKMEVTIRASTSKSKNWRTLKIHPTLLLHLKEYFRERNNKGYKTEKLIVANRGDQGLSEEGLKHWITSLKLKSGVRFHLHQFRHTFACRLAEADVHPFKIQKMMGHTSLTMTLKYVRSMRTEYMGSDIIKIII